MNVLATTGKQDLAQVYVAQVRDDPTFMVEFVDACGRRMGDRRQKWVIIISSQFGCPVKCLMCDAGGNFKGNVSSEEMQFQIETVVSRNHGLDPNECRKFKIQFARMGEPSLNDAVLDVLLWMKDRYPRVTPCIATVTPQGREKWFGTLSDIRDCFRDFQLQFSVNSTDDAERDRLMPYPKMSWEWLADYGKDFVRRDGRKVCLNFALCPDVPVNPETMREYFDPAYFVVKLTPLNPTMVGRENELTMTEDRPALEHSLRLKSADFERLGYHVIVSIGDLEENRIGSNCGQAVRKVRLTRSDNTAR